MKKIIVLILSISMLFALPTNAHASADIGNTYEINNVTVIFEVNSSLDAKTQERIANYIVSPEYGLSTAGLICTLFGHNNTSETVTTITHKVNSTDPRCLKEIFTVTTCSRCDETSMERDSYKYISCCPEE